MGKCLAALLAKIFNVTAVTGGYPKIWKRNKRIFIPKPSKALCGANGWQLITRRSLLAHAHLAFDGE
jgi:hypothetical protein